MFEHSATAIEGIAARAWKFFGCRFGESGEDRISKRVRKDRGAMGEMSMVDDRFSTGVSSTPDTICDFNTFHQ